MTSYLWRSPGSKFWSLWQLSSLLYNCSSGVETESIIRLLHKWKTVLVLGLLLWWNTMVKIKKSSCDGKGLFIYLYFHIITVHHQKKSGQKLKLNRNLEARSNTEAMACSSWLNQPFIELRTPAQGVLGPPDQPLIMKIFYKACIQKSIFFFIWAKLCVKLT